MPTAAMTAVPTPDQIAQAMPSSIRRIAIARHAKLIP